jgi:uncharacterized protein (DUF58 family)
LPTVEEYLRPDVIQQVARLDLKAKFIVEGFLSGLHSSPYQGFSTEFSEHRKYVVGDDLRSIDWNVFGRTDRFYIKKFQAETNLNCYLMVDLSKSMAYSYGSVMTKLDYSICMAAALGYLMINQQDAVGVVTFDEDIVGYVPPRSKRKHLAGILGLLARAPPGRLSKLGFCLHKAAELFPRRGLVILFSDLIPPPEENQEDVLDALRHLAFRGHDVICFHVLDHAELTLPHEGPTRFLDIETMQRITVEPEAVRDDYRREIQGCIEFYRSRCAEARIDFVPVDTAVSFDKVLVTYLLSRKSHF